MSVFTGLESWWSATEADVIAIVGKVIADVEVVESELQAGFSWLTNNAGSIASDINEVTGAINTVVSSGIVTNTTVAADLTKAAQAAQSAAAGVTAAAASVASGGTTTQALVAGYTAVVNAQAASTAAKQALVSAAAS